MNRLELDAFVRAQLGVLRGESINDAAKRVLDSEDVGRRRFASAIVLRSRRAPWDAMALAARVLGR